MVFYGPKNLPLPPIPYPDTRTILNQVNNLLLEGNKLMFNPIENADRYVISVDGKNMKQHQQNLF